MTTPPSAPITIMVSSTVYGLESLLDRVYATLTGFHYRVWMSHAGTIPLIPRLSNFENCLRAVEECDVFFSIITGRYGSGVDESGFSITHREILHAIELGKPSWYLVHHDVDVARQLLRQFRFTNHKPSRKRKLSFKRTPVLDDLRVLDMYEAAMRHDVPLSQRKGNWVQPFFRDDDVLRIIENQFSDPARIAAILQESGEGETE